MYSAQGATTLSIAAPNSAHTAAQKSAEPEIRKQDIAQNLGNQRDISTLGTRMTVNIGGYKLVARVRWLRAQVALCLGGVRMSGLGLGLGREAGQGLGGGGGKGEGC